jgi:enediyne biosynthesis protein E4
MRRRVSARKSRVLTGGSLAIAALMTVAACTSSTSSPASPPSAAATTGALSSGQTVTGDVHFDELSRQGTALDRYRRAPSPEHAIRVANKQKQQVTFGDYAGEPVHDRGIPGVVTFDYDNDGDLDLYVTNGPGRPDSLYRNDLGKDGKVNFVDVGQQAGVALTSVDANGACAGDIDNDGDMDLYVLGKRTSNHLLRNRGNGTFEDITAASSTSAGAFSHVSCTMADFDGNGKIDIAVANTFDMRRALAIFAVPYALNEKNQLLYNQDGTRFKDVSDSSGFTNIDVPDRPADSPPGPIAEISWAIAAVDYDQDGDADLVVDNDQAAYPMKKNAGLDRGVIRIHRNDGKGHFTDVTHQVGTAEPGGWMGLSFGDFNGDGQLDIFNTNAGDYLFLPLPEMGYHQGDFSTRWFLQKPDHTFVDPRASSLKNPLKDGQDPTLGGIEATPWGWGTATLDYDNDADTDIYYNGSLDGMFWVTGDNPGALLSNNGPNKLNKNFFPTFSLDEKAQQGGKDQRKRTVTGVSVGDLNQDGFDDIISVAQGVKNGPLTDYTSDAKYDFHSPFDKGSSYLKTYQRTGGGPQIPSILLKPTKDTTVDGDLSVEINSGNDNKSATIRTLGSIGLTPGAKVNRDGIGAVVTFTPQGDKAAIRPVIAGSSFASQDALEGTFGMGKKQSGTAEVLWPGGIRNKLYDVRPGERIAFPEIPCSYAGPQSLAQYTSCVQQALTDLTAHKVITSSVAQRFQSSALRAYDEVH